MGVCVNVAYGHHSELICAKTSGMCLLLFLLLIVSTFRFPFFCCCVFLFSLPGSLPCYFLLLPWCSLFLLLKVADTTLHIPSIPFSISYFSLCFLFSSFFSFFLFSLTPSHPSSPTLSFSPTYIHAYPHSLPSSTSSPSFHHHLSSLITFLPFISPRLLFYSHLLLSSFLFTPPLFLLHKSPTAHSYFISPFHSSYLPSFLRPRLPSSSSFSFYIPSIMAEVALPESPVVASPPTPTQSAPDSPPPTKRVSINAPPTKSTSAPSLCKLLLFPFSQLGYKGHIHTLGRQLKDKVT